MTATVELQNLGLRFGDVDALAGLTATFPAGSITGLLGRNGAGKSTLLSAIAGHRRPTSGAVVIDGDPPYDHPIAMSRTCLVRDEGDFDPTMTSDEVFEIAALLRTSWDQDYADQLVERFELPRRTKVGALSRGKRSALSVTVGLASRCPLTLFDEPQLGMDPPTRYAFYEELLADYVARPRTIVLSTHLVEEAASLFEHVLVLDHGRVLAHEPIDELRGRGVQLTGPADSIDALTAGHRVAHERRLGATKSVVVLEPLDGGARAAAAAAGVTLDPLPLQDLFVHLTDQEVHP